MRSTKCRFCREGISLDPLADRIVGTRRPLCNAKNRTRKPWIAGVYRQEGNPQGLISSG